MVFKYGFTSLILRASSIKRSSGSGTQNVNIFKCKAAHTLFKMCLVWTLPPVLLKVNLQMLAFFANIAHITVWTQDFVYKFASQILLDRFLQWWQHSSDFFKVKITLYGTLSITLSVHNCRMSLTYDSEQFPLYRRNKRKGLSGPSSLSLGSSGATSFYCMTCIYDV